MFISPEDLDEMGKLDAMVDYLSENIYNDFNLFDSEDDAADFIADIIDKIPNRKEIVDVYYSFMMNSYDLEKDEIADPTKLADYILNAYYSKSKDIWTVLNKEKLLKKFNYTPAQIKGVLHKHHS